MRVRYKGISYDSYYDIFKSRSVRIRSVAGQAQFFLEDARRWISGPNEWLLLCQFANIIGDAKGMYTMSHLMDLTRYLERCRFERKNGYADPTIAREVERAIIQQQYMMDNATGYDLTPAMYLLAEYEQEAPVFRQAERNLILREAFFFGDQARSARLAEALREKRLSPYRIEKLCRAQEEVQREWLGVGSMEGLQYMRTRSPGLGMSLANCEDPNTSYPPFAYYPPCAVPGDSCILANGVILLHDQGNWFYSSLQKVDETFTALHFYSMVKTGIFEITDWEHEEIFQNQSPEIDEETPFIGQVTFADGERWNFTNAEKYLQVIRDEFPHRLSTGFCYETLTNDPVICKAADDIRYEIEETSCTLADSNSRGMTMGGMG